MPRESAPRSFQFLLASFDFGPESRPGPCCAVLLLSHRPRSWVGPPPGSRLPREASALLLPGSPVPGRQQSLACFRRGFLRKNFASFTTVEGFLKEVCESNCPALSGAKPKSGLVKGEPRYPWG